MTREMVARYLALGWGVVRLRPKSKACRDEGWRDRTYAPEEFVDGDEVRDNVGIRLVSAASKTKVKLVAVDLDCAEASRLAWAFLPPSSAWGRKSKPTSQVLYDSPQDKPTVFKDVDGSVLLEIRVDHQSMAPPSVHPDGEEVAWTRGPTQAVKLDGPSLVRLCRLLATACLLGRAWPPPHSRHEWTLAASGALKGLGLREAEACQVVESAAGLGGDERVGDRLGETRSTYARQDDEKTAGIGRLGELSSERLAEALRKIWGERKADGKERKKGPGRDQAAIRSAIEKIGVRLHRNAFTGRIVTERDGARREWCDDELVHLWLRVDEAGVQASKEFFADVVRDEANKHRFHPVCDWLDSLTWDGKPRLDTWLIEYGGARDDPDGLVRAYGALTLIAAVKRVRKPGCKHDEMLVLIAPQGTLKSTAVSTLCPDESWFSSDLPMDVDTKELIERTQGRWIIEAAELAKMRGAQTEQLKAMLSRQVDVARMAYAREPDPFPRQFVVIGTTNSEVFLQDSTGNRRFWPVEIQRFDAARLAADRDQLWAEASKREADGESTRLDQSKWEASARMADLRREHDDWEDKLVPAFENARNVTTQEIYAVLGVDVPRQNTETNRRVTKIMQIMRFEKGTIRRGDGVTRGWVRKNLL